MPEIPATDAVKIRNMTTMVWLALITAVIVTIIDWKIKQDILSITDTFYRTTNGANNAGNNARAIVEPDSASNLPTDPRLDLPTGMAESSPATSDDAPPNPRKQRRRIITDDSGSA